MALEWLSGPQPFLTTPCYVTHEGIRRVVEIIFGCRLARTINLSWMPSARSCIRLTANTKSILR